MNAGSAWIPHGVRTAPGWRDQALDRSYRSAEGLSTRTRAADQPGGLPGVSRPLKADMQVSS